MNHQIYNEVIAEMSAHLNGSQLSMLENVLKTALQKCINEQDTPSNEGILNAFISAKRLEGCSDKTLSYYQYTVSAMEQKIGKPFLSITTEDLRTYLSEYQTTNGTSRVTIDNMRRNLSSFFGWLEDENYIIKSPVRRIHKVKATTTVKATYSDEDIEKLRDGCSEIRDTALIDILVSTGMRIGELVRLNRDDINYNERECVVFGKGDKERVVYFDAKTKLHLQAYIDGRTDQNPALFVTLRPPFERITIGGIEVRLRKIGRILGIDKVHPHKFRRTMATM